MPADREEITHLIEEGVEVLELAQPERLIIENGRLRALQCHRMEFSGDRDSTGRKIPREVPGADFEVPLDTMILAISQHAVLDFFDGVPIAINNRGYINADPQTFATSVPGIYAGGDAVNDGPSSIVKAAAAGKAIADSILQRRSSTALPIPVRTFDRSALLRRRAHRAWRVPVSVTPLADRQNFNEVVQTYTEAEARTEAARCLDCDTYCSICVGVCPNLALQTWQTEPLTVRLPLLQVADGALKIAAGDLYRVDQAYQVAVLNDFCNECGNCTTFCPTAGRPYQDKPRLFVDRASFEEQRENAFMVSNDENGWSMDSRWQGATHRIELNGSLEYSSPLLRVRLDPLTFAVEQAELLDKDATELSLEPCAAMFVLLRGIQKSMPYWATATMVDATAGKIAHPGYEE
jgi:putative selenate reductase